MKAMIFAAGLGTRLRPLTDTRPKALVDVAGTAALDRVARNLAAAGATDIVINIHHFPELMRSHIAAMDVPGARITVSDEARLLLDTGGGVVHAAPMLRDDRPVLLHNVDIMTSLDLADFYAEAERSGADALLLTSPRSTSRYLLFDSEGRMKGWLNRTTGQVRPEGLQTDGLTPLAFGGIHVVSQRLIRELEDYGKDRPKFSITDFYIDRCGDLDIRAWQAPADTRWHDIGRPESLRSAAEAIAAEQ